MVNSTSDEGMDKNHTKSQHRPTDQLRFIDMATVQRKKRVRISPQQQQQKLSRESRMTSGPTAWANDSHKAIEESTQLVRRAQKSCERSRSKDPLPGLRDVVAELSNDQARKHFRDVRKVTHLLMDTLIDTNTEIKSMTRAKEALEKGQGRIVKDMKVNSTSRQLRNKRPDKERVSDGADGLLQAERDHLQNLHQSVQAELDLVVKHLRLLDSSRKRLSAASQERSRALDLVPKAIPSGSTTRQKPSNDGYDGSGTSASLFPDPLGSYTPEVDEALQEARDAICRSKDLRSRVDKQLTSVEESQKSAMNSVNEVLDQKIHETNALKKQLSNAFEENRLATNKAQKTFDTTELAWLQLRGPVSSGDVSLREKLDRPIVKAFQQHPGTNLPEAHEIVQGTEKLLTSLRYNGENIGLLKLSQMKLQEDIESKKAALAADKQVVNIRRRKVAD